MASFYKKYRSQSFAELLNHPSIIQTIQHSIKENSFGHAYLFYGTRGIGKTSLARILARTLNCLQRNEDAEPCNQCESCKLALSFSHPDIIEMDAASNRGVEEIRMLRQGVDFLPTFGKYKIYIIDEVHMLTKEAFNALLKTLEEPPSRIIFILCTTELYKLPPTIISRCQVFEFKNASQDEIVSKLNYIAKEENFEIENEGLIMLSRLAKGSFRDAETLLERVIRGSKETFISLDYITATLGLTQNALVESMKECLIKLRSKEIKKNLLDIDDSNIIVLNSSIIQSLFEEYIDSADKDVPGILKWISFLSKIEPKIKISSHPKYLYLAEIQLYMKKLKSNELPDESSKSKLSKKTSSNPPMNPITSVKPSSLDSSPFSQKNRKESLIDFLQKNHPVIHKYFSMKNFEIKDEELTIKLESKMDQVLVERPALKKALQDFASVSGYHLKIVPLIESARKKVQNLSEDELQEMFKP